MKYEVVELEQDTEQWLEWRHTGIGGSDASTIMGENRFKSPVQLLYEKKNRIDEPSNEAMAEGKRLEPHARTDYVKKTNKDVHPICIQSVEYPWLLASLDGLSADRKKLVEIKCGKSSYRRATYEEVPEYYKGQLQHQLMITGLQSLDYWCYRPSSPGILLSVERDERYIELLFEEEKTFYEQMKKP